MPRVRCRGRVLRAPLRRRPRGGRRAGAAQPVARRAIELEATRVASEDELRAALDEGEFDLALLDYTLPGWDCREALAPAHRGAAGHAGHLRGRHDRRGGGRRAAQAGRRRLRRRRTTSRVCPTRSGARSRPRTTTAPGARPRAASRRRSPAPSPPWALWSRCATRTRPATSGARPSWWWPSAASSASTRTTVETLDLTARMHDIGQIAVPAEILTRPGRLSQNEFTLIKAHPQVAYDILVADRLRQAGRRGDPAAPRAAGRLRLPDGLNGDEILLEARILAVADVVEAMSSHRPYRRGARRRGRAGRDLRRRRHAVRRRRWSSRLPSRSSTPASPSRPEAAGGADRRRAAPRTRLPSAYHSTRTRTRQLRRRRARRRAARSPSALIALVALLARRGRGVGAGRRRRRRPAAAGAGPAAASGSTPAASARPAQPGAAATARVVSGGDVMPDRSVEAYAERERRRRRARRHQAASSRRATPPGSTSRASPPRWARPRPRRRTPSRVRRPSRRPSPRPASTW